MGPARAMANTWALVPVKSFPRAKSRLAESLPPGERAELARAMFDGVLDALAACDGIAGVLVATDGDDVAERAWRHGARVLRDQPDAPLGRVIDLALADLAGHGARAALVVMSDLPHLTAADARELLALLADHDLALAPDLVDEGTNALALRLAPLEPPATSFGSRGSFARHLARARAAGLTVAIARNPRLGFDVDGPEDFARLTARATP